ncbi:MAG: arginine N-succinyltransferase, partial [Oxalobacteraceae bacterium]
EQEGMYYEGYVDIFDAGPVLQARVSELRALRESTLAIIEPAAASVESAEAAVAPVADPVLVANTVLRDFRSIVVAAPPKPQPTRIALSASERELLGCGAGDPVRTMTLNPRKNS